MVLPITRPVTEQLYMSRQLTMYMLPTLVVQILSVQCQHPNRLLQFEGPDQEYCRETEE